jgi:hypothetical protein
VDAADATAGFLSSKAIHAQMKSQPPDFDSEDEEGTDGELIVSDSFAQPISSLESRSEIVAAWSPFYQRG